MSKLEAKILGEETVGYCSSDEDEGPSGLSLDHGSPRRGPPPLGRQGAAKNTGPKGVLQDWNLFQEQEKRRLHDKQDELKALCKSTALTCLSEREESNLKVVQEAGLDDDELISDDTLKDFMRARMEQMMRKKAELPEFGQLEDLPSGEEYLKVIDGTHPHSSVVVHIYESRVPECLRMNECLASLSSQYPRIRFCKIKGVNIGVTTQFKQQGVPALLVYKGGNLIGNFVGLKEEFGSEFYMGDVENYLIENGILEDKANVPVLWASSSANCGAAVK